MEVLLFGVSVFGVMPWWLAIAKGTTHHQVTALFGTLYAAIPQGITRATFKQHLLSLARSLIFRDASREIWCI